MPSDNDYMEVLERVKYKRFEKLENCVYNHLSDIKDSTTMAEVMDMAGV